MPPRPSCNGHVIDGCDDVLKSKLEGRLIRRFLTVPYLLSDLEVASPATRSTQAKTQLL
jgi:hypothetical protein